MDEREPGGGGRRPGPARALAGLAAALAVLLWMVAVASRNQRPDAAGPARGPLVASPRLLVSFYGVVLVLGLVQVALLASQGWRRRALTAPKKRAPWRGLVGVAALLLVCVILAGLRFPDWVKLGAGRPEDGPAPAAAVASGPAAERSPRLLGLEALALAGALVALAALVVVWRARSRRRRAGQGPGGAAEDLSAAIERSLGELHGELDPRQAVIAAYAAMELTLAAHGLPRVPAEAPLEYLARALLGLRVSAGSASALTELFERARFSQHAVDLAMKEDAIRALAAVRDDLKGVAA